MATIKTIYKGDLLAETLIGDHSVKTDLPESWGGKNRGPTPTALFIASLSSCIMALVANYCNQAGLDATGIEVLVSFEQAADPIMLVDLKAHITLPTDELKKRRKAILKVAETCPVHSTITNTADIEVTTD